MFGRYILSIFCVIALAGCATNNNEHEAPVVSGLQIQPIDKRVYRVHEGDTLYSIAWAYDLDYRGVARANNLSPNAPLRKGQMIKLIDQPPPAISPVEKPQRWTVEPVLADSTLSQDDTSLQPAIAEPQSPPLAVASIPSKPAPKPLATNSGVIKQWQWPVNGKVIRNFDNQGSKGIDISSPFGTPVKAAADGTVVYRGEGLRGYGKLILVKHSDSFLSAYAHNHDYRVKEGDGVKAGQEIAEVGRDTTGKSILHFEIRRDGKPVNPLDYLHNNR